MTNGGLYRQKRPYLTSPGDTLPPPSARARLVGVDRSASTDLVRLDDGIASWAHTLLSDVTLEGTLRIISVLAW
jgi:hypothetical protein